MNQHFRSNCASLYNASVRSKVSLKNCDSAGFAVWIFNRTDSLRVFIDTASNVFPYSLACAGHAVCVDKILLSKLVENRIYAACFIKILHVGMTGRSKMTKVWSFSAYLICNIKIYFNSALVCDSRKVEHTVCRAAKSHIGCKSIVECLFGS